MTSQFAELRTRIAVLETEHGRSRSPCRLRARRRKFLKQLATLQARETEIADEGKRLNEEKASLEWRSSTRCRRSRNDLAKAEAELKALDNPKAKIRLLEVRGAREGELRRSFRRSKAISNGSRATADLVEQLESYKDFDRTGPRQTEFAMRRPKLIGLYLTNEALRELGCRTHDACRSVQRSRSR